MASEVEVIGMPDGFLERAHTLVAGRDPIEILIATPAKWPSRKHSDRRQRMVRDTVWPWHVHPLATQTCRLLRQVRV